MRTKKQTKQRRAFEEKVADFEDEWNLKWDLKHEGFVMQFINRRAEAGEISPEVA